MEEKYSWIKEAGVIGGDQFPSGVGMGQNEPEDHEQGLVHVSTY